MIDGLNYRLLRRVRNHVWGRVVHVGYRVTNRVEDRVRIHVEDLAWERVRERVRSRVEDLVFEKMNENARNI